MWVSYQNDVPHNIFLKNLWRIFSSKSNSALEPSPHIFIHIYRVLVVYQLFEKLFEIRLGSAPPKRGGSPKVYWEWERRGGRDGGEYFFLEVSDIKECFSYRLLVLPAALYKMRTLCSLEALQKEEVERMGVEC